MREQVEAIYQNGILRPLTPLSLPENTRVEVTVQSIPSNGNLQRQHQAVRQALVTAGLSLSILEPIEPLSELLITRREELARLFSVGKPLSEVILEEREAN